MMMMKKWTDPRFTVEGLQAREIVDYMVDCQLATDENRGTHEERIREILSRWNGLKPGNTASDGPEQDGADPIKEA